ncbi:hypothetical protein [Candidatus Leptofilum sp.]|uniref:hypothetical protein n=1 Tax=Candidatus Leptofilum sp. TaxID=3241576 RepID=UPI003B5C4D4B
MNYSANPKQFCLLLLILLALAACRPEATPEPEPTDPATAVSTQASTPTATAVTSLSTNPTQLPSATSHPTNTPMPTATPSPRQLGPFTEVALMDELITGSWQKLHSSPTGDLFFASTNEVLRFDDNEWAVYLPEYNGRFIGFDSQDRVWVLSEDGAEIAAWDGNTWQAFGTEAGWEVTTSVYQQPIVEDDQGSIWLSARTTIRQLVDGRWQTHTIESVNLTLPDGDASDWDTTLAVAYIQPTNEIWIGQCNFLTGNPSGGGLSILRDGAWQPTTINDTSPCIWAIAARDDGNIWLLSENTLYQSSQSGEWIRHDEPEGAYGLLTSLDFDAQGRPLANFSECIQGHCHIQEDYFRLDDGQWTLLADDEIEFGPVTNVADGDGNDWVFLAGNTYQIVGDELVLALENFSTAWTNTAVDADGRFWFVVTVDDETGLWRFTE